MLIASTKSKLHQRLLGWCQSPWLLALLFALLHDQRALYSSNQNTYFLHGLAAAGQGQLSLDWLAQTVDTFPLFSALVQLVVQWLHPKVFYFIHLGLALLYAASLLQIARWILLQRGQAIGYGLLWLLLAMLMLPNEWVHDGLAGQYLLGATGKLQPSVFGVLLLFGIYQMLRQRLFTAVSLVTLAAVFHSSYLLAAALLVLVFLLQSLVGGGGLGRTLLAGLLSLALITPSLLYVLWVVEPFDQTNLAQAQRILVEFRLPHHAKVESWFTWRVPVQLSLLTMALFMVRTLPLLAILAVPSMVALALTLLQVFRSDYGLALLFPWRVSVFVLPMASIILLTQLLVLVRGLNLPRWAKPRPLADLPGLEKCYPAILLLLLLAGVVNFGRLLTKPPAAAGETVQLMAASYQPGDLYLTPPEQDKLRIGSGVPIVADMKSHPYKSEEVVAWYQRLELVQRYYQAPPDIACSALQRLITEYRVSKVVANSDSAATCGMLRVILQGNTMAIFEVSQGDSGG